MQLPVYSLKNVNWYIYGKDKQLLLKNYPIRKELDFRSLKYPFLSACDIDGNDVLVDFFSGHLLPFHYYAFGERLKDNILLRSWKNHLPLILHTLRGIHSIILFFPKVICMYCHQKERDIH